MVHRVIALISPGMDSPVAAHLLAQRGAKVMLLHLDTHHSGVEGELTITEALAERLNELHHDMPLFRTPFDRVQREIKDRIDEHFRCIICRRMMYRVGAEMADEFGADALATGESLGQVASQTLSNLTSEDGAVHMTLHRPLLGFDKNEIIEIAEEIGTYQISIRSSKKCRLMPNGPRVRSDVKDVEEMESSMSMESLLDEIEFNEVRI